MRPQDVHGDGRDWTFETLEHGGDEEHGLVLVSMSRFASAANAAAAIIGVLILGGVADVAHAEQRPYRNPAVILIDQVKEIYIDAVLEPVETANWFPKIYRKDYTIGINGTESGVDDPDQQFYENFVCGAVRNYTGYCSPEVDKLIDQQSAEPNREKRKQLVWQIERKLAEDGARPIIFYPRGGTCSQPYVKGLVTMVNSIYNGYRMEDVWLDK
jgi:ABC-type transport system substrate-binding protein